MIILLNSFTERLKMSSINDNNKSSQIDTIDIQEIPVEILTISHGLQIDKQLICSWAKKYNLNLTKVEKINKNAIKKNVVVNAIKMSDLKTVIDATKITYEQTKKINTKNSLQSMLAVMNFLEKKLSSNL